MKGQYRGVNRDTMPSTATEGKGGAVQGSALEYAITLDDDPMVSRMIQKVLRMKSVAFTSVAQLVAAADQYRPAAAFIDIHLDESSHGNGGAESASGLEAIPQLRAKWPFCPIIVVTGDPSDEAVTEALACGADDFIRKPIRPKELMARLQARFLDHAQKEARNTLQIGDVMLDRSHRLLRGPHGDRYLSSTEFNLFLALLQARGTTVPRETLKLRCWGDIVVSENALDRKIYEVRHALKEVSSRLAIHTVYGVGFAIDTTQAIAEAPAVTETRSSPGPSSAAL